MFYNEDIILPCILIQTNNKYCEKFEHNEIISDRTKDIYHTENCWCNQNSIKIKVPDYNNNDKWFYYTIENILKYSKKKTVLFLGEELDYFVLNCSAEYYYNKFYIRNKDVEMIKPEFSNILEIYLI